LSRRSPGSWDRAALRSGRSGGGSGRKRCTARPRCARRRQGVRCRIRAAPHIHFRVSGRDFAPLATQLYVAGHPLNENDFLLSAIVDPKARASLIVPFERVAGQTELAAKFDIVLAANGTLRAT
jgi:protocatechuate 3,4-dioxygenase beta subunit